MHDMCMSAHVCVRSCVCARMRVCAHACVRVSGHAYCKLPTTLRTYETIYKNVNNFLFILEGDSGVYTCEFVWVRNYVVQTLLRL